MLQDLPVVGIAMVFTLASIVLYIYIFTVLLIAPFFRVNFIFSILTWNNQTLHIGNSIFRGKTFERV